jgi:hypothetical protein
VPASCSLRTRDIGQVRTTSVVLKDLDNAALPDVVGQEWEWAKARPGKGAATASKPKFLRCKGEFQLLFREDGGQWGVAALSTA